MAELLGYLVPPWEKLGTQFPTFWLQSRPSPGCCRHWGVPLWTGDSQITKVIFEGRLPQMQAKGNKQARHRHRLRPTHVRV